MSRESDQSYCAALARSVDYDRYLAGLFAPADARPAIWAVLAFAAELARAPAAASEPAIGEIRLHWWRETLDGIYRGAPRATPVARTLAAAAHGLSRDRLERMVEARSAELWDGPPADLAALERHAEATAGEVARLTLEALGLNDGPAHEAARRVGIAWGLSRSAEREPVAAAARAHLDAARRLAGEVPRRALPALLPAVLAEAALGRGGAGLLSRRLRVAAAAWRGRY